MSFFELRARADETGVRHGGIVSEKVWGHGKSLGYIDFTTGDGLSCQVQQYSGACE